MTSKRRRKLDQYVRGAREDPEVVLQEMAYLSNRLFRLMVGLVLTGAMVFLAVWPLRGPLGWASAVGVGLILLLANGLTWFAVQRVEPRAFERPAAFNQLIFLSSLTVFLSYFVFKIGWSPLLAPLSMFGMVLAITFGQPVSFLLVGVMGFYFGILDAHAVAPEGGSLFDVMLATSLTMGGLASVLGMSRVRQQSRPFVVGAYAGLAQAIVVLAFKLLAARDARELASSFNLDQLPLFFRDAGWALAGGLISGAAVTCFLPALEKFFGITTERRLLALLDPNHDLQKVLRTEAPGTHTHSLRVADLAAAAAEAIGADPLLSRVGAYYHDIGKISKPEYFVENRESGFSIHDRLRPSMSKLIIISHIKEGVELAEEQGLPQKVIDMIPMHHGTTVVEYFYHKAKIEGDHSEPEVEYRYPGPRPRFKEAGILMLADGVEATAKAIPDPNPNRFRTMVHDLILKRLLDHQLDESDLTMRDLARIEESLVRTLTYMYHGRIKYPDRGPEGGHSGGHRGDSRAPGGRRPAQPPGGRQQPLADHETHAFDRLPAQGEPGHEPPDHHLKPAEVSSGRSGSPQKDAFGHPERS